MAEPDHPVEKKTPEPLPVTQDYAPEPESGEFGSLGEKLGTRIGPYTLVEAIGEGGMGSVYRAEQVDPVKRTVALKLIKAGMDTRHVLARFEAERQALALMDHPNIARVLDAGATDAGRPFFVMELVRGVPITKFCDEHGLTPRERLELFIPVCQAIQHAHQKGIIHRDIKPSNVLVAMYDGRPVPKVIDFGVAKATEGQFAEAATFTGFGNVVGTPEYMSPEQAAPGQLDIDTRSDVYALGVLLYELLAGSTPHDRARLKKAALLEILRVIREEEPPRPSTKLSSSDALPSIAANRRMDPARLTRLIRGELDWVVMKALEKDRDRRYATANGFAADVQRYLADEPVSAGPPSRVYRMRKFVRRNKASVLAASLVVVALLAGVVGTSIGMVRADRARVAEERQREAAENARIDEARQRARAQTIAEFMQGILEGAGPSVAKGRDGKLLKELMDAAAARIDGGKLKDDPEAESELRRTIGNVYQALSELDSAEGHLRRSVTLAKTIFDADDKRIDSSDLDLGACLLLRGQYDEAKSIAERVVAATGRRGESDTERAATAWDLLGMAQYNASGGQLAEAEKSHQHGLAPRKSAAVCTWSPLS
jgi:eukaryotic-like serine/threonine-protein kinase